MDLKDDFEFQPLPPIPLPPQPPLAPLPGHPIHPIGVSPLGPLQLLPGEWTGKGFNQIWRPFHGQPPGQDRFLELNLTEEDLEFKAIPGNIPNRGLLQPDINLVGVTYLQQIKDANLKAGIHVEPGIWVTSPATSAPVDPATVARMASIPHGTTLLAQGVFETVNGPPVIPVASITPFRIILPPPAPQNPVLVPFPESTLAIPTPFRSPAAQLVGITQGMVDDPNSVLRVAIAGQTILRTTVLKVSTNLVVAPVPSTGGGTTNTAFLAGENPAKPNALAAQVDATFWIETVRGVNGRIFQQLQYSQRVLLNFNGLSWPHVSVATLIKAP
jgi:hypothetical protein